MEGINQAARPPTGDEPPDLFAGLDENLEFKVIGQFPWGGTYNGFDELRAAFAPTEGRMSHCAKGGVYPTEFIGEGNKVVAICLGRGVNAEGEIYNNSYFLFYEVKDGKVARFQEHNDGSLSWRRVMNCNMVPG